MNGKSISDKPIDITFLRGIKTAERVISNKSEADRESSPNQYQKQKKKRKPTEEEVKKALSIIEDLSGFKKNNFKIQQEENHWLIVDPAGNTVRRLDAYDLLDYLEIDSRVETEAHKGTLLKKTV